MTHAHGPQQRHALRAGLLGAALAAVTLFVPAGVSAAYLLQPGDVLEFAATGAPDLKQRAPVEIDGSVALPLIGRIEAAGHPVALVREKVQLLIANKVYRRRSDSGDEFPVTISPDEISLIVTEYRPVYLSGDVSKPGEQPFRPGMTVRQAIALSGGFDIMRFRMENPFLEQADLAGEYNSLWTQFAEDTVTVERVRAELEGAAQFDVASLGQAPVSPDITAQIKQIAQDQLAARNAIHAREKSYLSAAVKSEQERINLLTQQQDKERQGSELDDEDLTRVQGLLEKGHVPITRVIEARRLKLFSSTRLLQTIAEQAKAERERDQFDNKLQQIDDERRNRLLGELQGAQVRLETTGAKLRAIGEKIRYVGMVRSQLVRKGGAAPQIDIFRQAASGSEKIAANEETELHPGDTIEIRLQAVLPETELSAR